MEWIHKSLVQVKYMSLIEILATSNINTCHCQMAALRIYDAAIYPKLVVLSTRFAEDQQLPQSWSNVRTALHRTRAAG